MLRHYLIYCCLKVGISANIALARCSAFSLEAAATSSSASFQCAVIVSSYLFVRVSSNSNSVPYSYDNCNQFLNLKLNLPSQNCSFGVFVELLEPIIPVLRLLLLLVVGVVLRRTRCEPPGQWVEVRE